MPRQPTRQRSPIDSAGSTKETGDTNAARTVLRSRPTGVIAPVGHDRAHRGDGDRVADGDPVGRGPVPLRRVPARQGRGRGQGEYWRLMDGHARPRQPAAGLLRRVPGPPVLQHVRPVSRGPDRRALVRRRSGSCSSTCCAPPAARSRASSSAGRRRRSARQARSSGCSASCLPSNQIHRPVDRQSRMLVQQLGFLIIINIVFGFAIPNIDNAAHIGGLLTGLWIGALWPPHHVEVDVVVLAARPRRPGATARERSRWSCPSSSSAWSRSPWSWASRSGRRGSSSSRPTDVRDAAWSAATAAPGRGCRRREALLDACLELQAEHGLEPATDGGWPRTTADPVASWRATARTCRSSWSRRSSSGRCTSGRGDDGHPGGGRRAGRRGLPLDRDPRAGGDLDRRRTAEARARFVDAHVALTRDVSPDVHLSLAITGGERGCRGRRDDPRRCLCEPGGRPDRWTRQLATSRRRAGRARRHLRRAIGARGSDDGPEDLLVGGALRGRQQGSRDRAGRSRDVGFHGRAQLGRGVDKVRRLGDAARLVWHPPRSGAQALDPRAVDIRSAALGRVEPGTKQRPSPTDRRVILGDRGGGLRADEARAAQNGVYHRGPSASWCWLAAIDLEPTP